MYFVITNVWATYISVSSLISIYIALSQCDLMLIRLFADISANMCTMYLYMEVLFYFSHQHFLWMSDVFGMCRVRCTTSKSTIRVY